MKDFLKIDWKYGFKTIFKNDNLCTPQERGLVYVALLEVLFVVGIGLAILKYL